MTYPPSSVVLPSQSAEAPRPLRSGAARHSAVTGGRTTILKKWGRTFRSDVFPIGLLVFVAYSFCVHTVLLLPSRDDGDTGVAVVEHERARTSVAAVADDREHAASGSRLSAAVLRQPDDARGAAVASGAPPPVPQFRNQTTPECWLRFEGHCPALQSVLQERELPYTLAANMLAVPVPGDEKLPAYYCHEQHVEWERRCPAATVTEHYRAVRGALLPAAVRAAGTGAAVHFAANMLAVPVPGDEKLPAYYCHEQHVEWERRCPAATVTEHYRGPFATSALRDDGSWLVNDLDGSIFYLYPIQLKPFHSCFKMKSREWNKWDPTHEICFPLVNVVGYPKCGTSAVYNLLASHPKVVQAHKNKEYCYRKGNLFRYFKNFEPATVNTLRQKLMVNGCINYRAHLMVDRVLRRPNSLNLFVVRDMADFEWARYNFWCSPLIDADCEHFSRWTVVGTHHRSPEDFHRKILEKAGGDFMPHYASVRDYYTRTVAATDLRLTVLSAEMLKHDIGRVWEIVQRAAHEQTGVELRRHPDLKTLQTMVVNSNNNKGVDVATSEAAADGEPVGDGLYEISGYRPMLDETRALIHSWWDECEHIANISGWDGYDCKKRTADI
eukprot:CAMPEP_0194346302 /NCGR_PEP_ID=MMETSP0171-20130528/105348_1 /TAXON_ID=218684 /ORGANISM="Corethron pennatum, Strain L29A3" /LENGTH=610 /DNA_ID=CAMNT_0039113407 /DNA_START=172 /DNA_END=2005 /DNA_ORIENTATION=+